MPDILDDLARHDRRTVLSMAAAAGVSADVLLPQIVSAYLRLLKDVPAALPRDPMADLGLSRSRVK